MSLDKNRVFCIFFMAGENTISVYMQLIECFILFLLCHVTFCCFILVE